MSYSYSSPLTYGPSNLPVAYEDTAMRKPSSAPYAAGGFVLGAAGGAYAGSRKNPYISKNGEVSDSFAIKVYEKYLNKASDAGKEAYEQGLEILKKLDKTSTPEELKTLLNANEEAVKEICTELKQSPDSFVENITKENLSANKKTIKERLTAANKNRYQNMKNQIQSCWDKKPRKFKKPDNIKQEVFDTIKNASKGGKAKIIAKYSLIAGAITGAVAYAAHKIFSQK